MRGIWGTRLAFLCTFALASGCAGVHRDQAPATQAAAPQMQPQDYSCTRAEAKAVRLSTLEGHRADFADQCVRVALFTDGVNFAENAVTIHTPAATGSGSFAFVFEDPARQRPRNPSFVSIVGRVRLCANGAPQTCRDGVYISDIRLLPTAMD
jgi:hypothetical protein